MTYYSELFKSPEHIKHALDGVDYLCDDVISTACFLAGSMARPLYFEGEPGVGKTALAYAVSTAFHLPLYRLQCYEGIDRSQALYDWDFRKQLFYLRLAQPEVGQGQTSLPAQLYDRSFLLERPILKALESAPCVLLIDEVDRADDEFEAFLLEVLSDFAITIPELGTIKPQTPPLVFLTSNRTRQVHDALKRRCLYHWVEHPDRIQEIAILNRKCLGVERPMLEDMVAVAQRLRTKGLLKAPGVSEVIDWATSVHSLGIERIDKRAMDLTIASLLKYKEDQERVRENDYQLVFAARDDQS